jgi:hypothetical protein
MHYKIDPDSMEIYAETGKRRYLVGVLTYHSEKDNYSFLYEFDYMMLRSGIPLGPDLPYSRLAIESEPGKLFATLLDRLPSKENPAYPDYCYSQGISPDEKNLIILLATIGRRGPSSFVFEPVFIALEDTVEALKQFRQDLQLTRYDFAMAFGFAEITIEKVEKRITQDRNILRLIDSVLNYPEIALAQLEITGKHVHAKVRTRLFYYFKEQLGLRKPG